MYRRGEVAEKGSYQQACFCGSFKWLYFINEKIIIICPEIKISNVVSFSE